MGDASSDHCVTEKLCRKNDGLVTSPPKEAECGTLFHLGVKMERTEARRTPAINIGCVFAALKAFETKDT